MKGLIVYATCYGSTRKYAEWIAEDTGFTCRCNKEVTDDELRAADTIVLGSWVLAHKLFLAKWIEEKKDLLMGKKLYLYSVSGAKPGDKVLDNVFTDSADKSLLEGAGTYQFGGRRETKNMSGFHKFMMWIATTFIEKDPDKKEEMKKYVDNVDRSYTKALVKEITAEVQDEIL